jgi:hypothetical protein
MQDTADFQAGKAWAEDRLSDGTILNLQGYDDETGIWVSEDATGKVPARAICVQCLDGGFREGLRFDHSGNPRGSYPGHAHTKRQGDLPGPGDYSGVLNYGRAYVLTPQGAFAVQGRAGAYYVRQISGDPLDTRQLRALESTIEVWNRPGGAQCRPVSMAMCR